MENETPRLLSQEEALGLNPGPDTLFLPCTKQQKDTLSAIFQFPVDWQTSFRKEYNQEISLSTESRNKENE